MKHIPGFIDDVLHQAEWRGRKAVEYPDDVRNINSSRGLTEMAAWLTAQPSDSPLLLRLDAALDSLYIEPGIPISKVTMVPSVNDILAQFRFGRIVLKSEGFEEFLHGIIATIERHVTRGVSESKLRRLLAKQGSYALRKSRLRSPGIHLDNLGGYMIVDLSDNTIVTGERYDLSLEDVATFIGEGIERG